MGMDTLVGRVILQDGWEVTPPDSPEEDKELELLAYQGQVVVLAALDHLGLLAGYVVVGMVHNFGICVQTMTNIIIK